MSLSPPLRDTLTWVASVMGEAADPWWVIASAAAALHGVTAPEVGDVDVLASDRDAAALLGRLGIEPLVVPAHPLFRSRILGRWTAAPMIVEVMSGFHIRDGPAWREVRPDTREPVDMNGVRLFVPSRAELASMLTAVGRPKDLERARRLATPGAAIGKGPS